MKRSLFLIYVFLCLISVGCSQKSKEESKIPAQVPIEEVKPVVIEQQVLPVAVQPEAPKEIADEDLSSNRLCVGFKCLNVEVAWKDADRIRGLQGRTSLEKDAGMLFIFAKSDAYGFWMKDTLISLDIVWISYEKKIVHIEHNVPPCTADPCPVYKSEESALYVLEASPGFADNLKEGDRVKFNLAL